MSANPQTMELVPVKTHMGQNLIYLADHYQDPYEAVREAIQNALDPDVKAPNFLVDIDLRKEKIRILDDGAGWSKEDIRHRLQNICRSDKAGGAESYGRKGIGNLAGIAISEELHVLTRPKAQPGPFYRLMLKRRDLPSQEELRLPVETLAEFKIEEGPYTTMVIYKNLLKGTGRRRSAPVASAAGEDPRPRRKNAGVPPTDQDPRRKPV